jgi:hypothetical protein
MIFLLHQSKRKGLPISGQPNVKLQRSCYAGSLDTAAVQRREEMRINIDIATIRSILERIA